MTKRKKRDPLAAELRLVLCQGVEGNCLYLNDYRIAGPKPWGGGKVIKEWNVSLSDVASAIGENNARAIAKLGAK